MPKLPMDYSKTVMYKLVCNDLLITDCYVGHTTDFIRRKYEHKKRCCNENQEAYNLKVYKCIREHGGWSNWSMIEIEKYPCNDSNEATARERYWLENLKPTLNCQIPNRSKKEYYEENKEHLKEYNKVWNEKNKEYKKEWYELNKEKIKEKNYEKFTCDCGGKYTRINKLRHEKTKKHLAYFSKQI